MSEGKISSSSPTLDELLGRWLNQVDNATKDLPTGPANQDDKSLPTEQAELVVGEVTSRSSRPALIRTPVARSIP